MKSRVAICLVGLLAHSSLYGQRSAASLSGNIIDPSGASVADATIVLHHLSTGRVSTAQSDSNGMYLIPTLAPGIYRFRCEKAGFQNYEDTRVELQIGQSASLSVTLRVGSQSETVTVTDTASLVDVRSHTLATSIPEVFTQSLPLNGRNSLQLILISPAVSPATTSLYTQTARPLKAAPRLHRLAEVVLMEPHFTLTVQRMKTPTPMSRTSSQTPTRSRNSTMKPTIRARNIKVVEVALSQQSPAVEQTSSTGRRLSFFATTL